MTGSHTHARAPGPIRSSKRTPCPVVLTSGGSVEARREGAGTAVASGFLPPIRGAPMKKLLLLLVLVVVGVAVARKLREA
jgi:hypothetical protein